MPVYQVGQWVWDEVTIPPLKFWRPPGEGCVGAIDLRSLPEQAQAGGVGGQGLFAYETEQPGLLKLDDPRVGEVLGLDVPDLPLGQLIAFLLQQGDPSGQTRWRPLLPTNDRWQIYLGGLVYDKPLSTDLNDPDWQSALRVLRYDYAQLRAEYRALGSTQYLKVLGFWARQYALDYRVFLGDQPDEGVLDPKTSYTETFNKANGALGPNLSWTNLQSAVTVASNTIAWSGTTTGSWTGYHARADADLSSADHYAQIVHLLGPNLGSWWSGPMIRKDSSSTITAYVCLGGNIGIPYLYKEIAGTGTTIGSVNGTENWFTAATLRLSAVGSSLVARSNGVVKDIATDTAITTGLRTGFAGAIERDGMALQWDNFEARDSGELSHDATSAFGYTLGAGNISGTHTCTGTNRVLFAVTFGSTGVDDITGVTYAGVAMTKVRAKLVPADRYLTLWQLIAPATGANTLTATYTGSDARALSAVSYMGVNQTTPLIDISDGSNAGANLIYPTNTLSISTGWFLVATKNNNNASLTTDNSGSVQDGVVRLNAPVNGLGFTDSNMPVAAGSKSIALLTSPTSPWAWVTATLVPASGGPIGTLLRHPGMSGRMQDLTGGIRG